MKINNSKKKNQKVNSKQQNPKTNLQSYDSVVDESTLVQAIVKAYQIIEDNKQLEEEKLENQKNAKKKTDKEKWYIKILFILNVLAFPWKINKRFTINNQIYDGILVLFVSFVLEMVGAIIWFAGVCAIINGVVILFQGFTVNVFVTMWSIGVMLLVFGSLFTLAGNEFSKVSDSNRIYAYSASIIALISCVVAIVSMAKQFM